MTKSRSRSRQRRRRFTTFTDPTILGSGPKPVRRMARLSLPSLISAGGAALLALGEVLWDALGFPPPQDVADGAVVLLLILYAFMVILVTLTQIATVPAAILTFTAPRLFAKQSQQSGVSRKDGSSVLASSAAAYPVWDFSSGI